MEQMITMAKLLKEASSLFTSITDKQLSSRDITWQQVLILEQIVQRPKTIGEISKATGLSYSTLSGLIDRLEKENIVVRVKDKKDKRIVWITKSERLDYINDVGRVEAANMASEQNTMQMISSFHNLQDMISDIQRKSS